MFFLFLISGLGFGFCLSRFHGRGLRRVRLRLTGLLSLARSRLAGFVFHVFFFLKAWRG